MRCLVFSGSKIMKNIRLIARLDIKAPNLIKGINLEGVRVVGDPQVYAEHYYQSGIDEIIYMDVVASLFERNSLEDLVARTADEVFVPMTVGGGIRSLEDVDKILRSGADKIAINTAAIKRPELINEVAKRFGSQCMVLSVEAKQMGHGRWEVYTDNGRNKTGMDVVSWVKQAASMGVGEILLTSVDNEGTCVGFDVELIKAVTGVVTVPVIASGGMGSIQHLIDVVEIGGADAVAMAHVLHYKKIDLQKLRLCLKNKGYDVRDVNYATCSSH